MHHTIIDMVSFEFSLFVLILSLICSSQAMYEGQEFPPGCDKDAAQICEYELLQCQLFTGPSDDPATMCACASTFYGDCLRRAGCETARQVGALTQHEVYMKVCVDTIMKYDCPDTTMCSINCASETLVQPSDNIIPFNNYGEYYLRMKFCRRIVDPIRKKRYGVVDAGDCKTLSDYQICTRWIPPLTFVPVAIPSDTTFAEIDSCRHNDTTGESYCLNEPKPARVYGNQIIWPRSYDVAQTEVSICSTDADCLGSFCDFTFLPPVCSPKSLRHVSGRMLCVYEHDSNSLCM